MAIDAGTTELQEATGADAATATRLSAVCKEIANRYVNNDDVPESILNEAVIRLAGWLYESPAGRTSQLSLGPDMATRFNLSHNAALRHSGAMSLLSPYRRRRADSIK